MPLKGFARHAGALIALLALLAACERKKTAPSEPASHPSQEAPRAPPSAKPTAHAPAEPPKPSCPEGMELLPGGEFWVGADPGERFADDESPRYLTRLSPFCIDRTEVTTRAYEAAVTRGESEPAHAQWVTCNTGRQGRENHPINCVSWSQAEAHCRARGARLPTEAEWEYAARGGTEYRAYPWGDQAPAEQLCWKRGKTCPVASFPAGAFGLFDMSGNVWEWTEDYYGPYPWPPRKSFHKVYRGGSWSRRFPKWLHTRLRNRSRPSSWGSHLGFRCALVPEGAPCPYGKLDNGDCRHGVEDRSCQHPGESFNGVRCAPPGAPRCQAGRVEEPGYGCVPEEPKPLPTRLGPPEIDSSEVTRERSPEFDEDCATNQGARPHAYRYTGATHRARNQVGESQGCKNRDVGVGWNSACCP